MKHKGTSPFESDEQALYEFGDTIAGHHGRPPENELEATVVRVQTALRASTDEPGSMPDDLKTQIWEDIMATANAATDHGTLTSRSTPASPKAQPIRQRESRTQGTPQPIPYRRMMWSGAANVALALVVLLAAFGAWRVFDGAGSFGGGDDGPPTVPRVAMQPSNSQPRQAAAVLQTPEATPAPANACDLSGDIPYFTDVEKSPVEGTSLYVTPRNHGADDPTGTLMLHCAEEPEDIELAGRITSAGPGPISGVLSVWLMPKGSTDLAGTRTAYLNLRTGEIGEFGRPEEAATSNLVYASGSPWVIGPSVDDASVMQVLDLRTMEATNLATLIGSEVPADATLMATGGGKSGTLAFAFRSPYTMDSSSSGSMLRDPALTGDVMIIDDSLDSIRGITLPDSLPNVTDMWMSPDGSSLAVASFVDGEFMSAPRVYAVINTDDGSELGRSEAIEQLDNPLALWVQDGEAIAYTAGNTIQVLPATTDAQPETVLEKDQEVYGVRTTTDSNVVVAQVHKDYESDANPASTDMDMVYAVNVATGEISEFEGMEMGSKISWITSTNALLMYDYAGQGPGTVTIRVYDPVSGNLVQEIADVPNPNDTGSMSIGKNSITSTDDGRTMAYTIGSQNIYVVQTQNGAPVLRQLDPPTAATSPATIALSPDGTALSMVNTNDESRTRWMLDLTDPAAQWLEVANEAVSSDPGMITFFEGTGG